MSDRFVVIGAGGHGRVVADALRACGSQVVGFVDGNPALVGTRPGKDEARVIATLDELLNDPEGVPLALAGEDASALAFALGIGDNEARLSIVAGLAGRPLPPIVHPAAYVSTSASIGPGSVVLPGAVVHTSARIGCAVIVNSGAVVEHDCVVADGAHVSPNATLAGGVRVGEGAWIGAGATVIEGRAVGAWALVGAGASVIRDVEAHTRVVGVPARVLGDAR